MTEPVVDVLIPTYRRPYALAVTLTGLLAQTFKPFRAVISDQSPDDSLFSCMEVSAVRRILEASGRPVLMKRNVPPRGMAEQRQFLLDASDAPLVLFLDDDLVLLPHVLRMMVDAIADERCGFVGCAPIGLSYLGDVRPEQQTVEFWDGPVQPETVRPGSREWFRFQLHNAANVYHVQTTLGLTPDRVRKYKVAWIGGCVLYDSSKLRDSGGFRFWSRLPERHCGEDVQAQLEVMMRHGGCGLLPSGVFHQELPTTLPDRSADAPHVLKREDERRS